MVPDEFDSSVLIGGVIREAMKGAD